MAQGSKPFCLSSRHRCCAHVSTYTCSMQIVAMKVAVKHLHEQHQQWSAFWGFCLPGPSAPFILRYQLMQKSFSSVCAAPFCCFLGIAALTGLGQSVDPHVFLLCCRQSQCRAHLLCLADWPKSRCLDAACPTATRSRLFEACL